jgi:hypothetical protein
MNLLGFAGYGTDAIGLAVASWYGSTKVAEHFRRQSAWIEASLDAKPPSPAARPPAPKPAPGLLSADPVGEADTKQQAEGLLGYVLGQADQPYATARPPVSRPVPGPLSLGLADDEVADPDPEKLLGAKMERFTEPLFDLATGPLEWLWRRLAFLGWLRLAVAVPFALVLFGVGCVLIGVMLPFAIIGFLNDSGKDFRLRLIVLAFAAGISLQFLSALPG